MPEAPLPPGGTIGILGGGQLGRMLATAASRLGLKTHIYSDETAPPASDVAARTTIGSYDNHDAIANFARSADVVTCEFENVPAVTLEAAAEGAPVFPPPRAFAVAQDRLVEKEFVSGLGIQVAPFAAVEDLESLKRAISVTKLPAILKTRRFGYDGKGQVLIRNRSEAETALEAIDGVPALLEGMVLFEREISVIVVRGKDGELHYYDPVENVHQNGILATSTVPASIPDDVAYAARTIAGKIADALSYVGVLCVEMFQCEGSSPNLVVNEMAPRVHNSGHWTLDACLVSQFENHIRAIAGWPLGEPSRHNDAVMTNLIGDDVNRWPELAATEGTCLHLYGKAEARAGRKMGHYTRVFPKT
ncbi:MAG TPA: 5-(carboxyamino)imidazole ribonucleotide synthase [Methyloceanibacter sp.]|nr:5-(carboxyamino)imidazole ribonucleotide synthase [Methyloceanibacter sp.]